MKRRRIKQFSAAYLHQRLDYNPITGILSWAAGVQVGKSIKACPENGYMFVRLDGVLLRVHCVAWKMTTGEDPRGEIDHINRVRSDNRLSNLRDIPPLGNKMNRSVYSSNKSGISGVHWDRERQKWAAQIKVNYRSTHLGRFDSLEEAAAVRRQAELEYFGEFAPNP